MQEVYNSAPVIASQSRTANLLGALALRLVDEMNRAIAEATGLGDSAAAALIGLARKRKRPIEYLRRLLGLSHPATVRLVDRLCEAGLVVRRPGPDGRTVVPVLTRAGLRKAQAVSRARAAVLEDVVRGLDQASRAQITRILEAVLEEVPRDQRDAANLCRICDLAVCNRGAKCPVDVGVLKATDSERSGKALQERSKQAA